MTAAGKRYVVQVDKAAAKLLRKLDHPVQAKLVAVIATLAHDPRPAGVIALAGHPGLLGIRVGDYRVVYTVDDTAVVVLVVHLGHRRRGLQGPLAALCSGLFCNAGRSSRRASRRFSHAVLC